MKCVYAPILMIAATLVSAAAPAPEVPTSVEARIPRFRSEGFIEYRRDGSRGLYIHAIGGGWYYARPAGNCSRLASAAGLGFETSELGYFDRNSTIVADGERCMLASVIETAPPPPRR